jgi:NADP-dependent 3-hydroxy acid dehydrogenase YdfG
MNPEDIANVVIHALTAPAHARIDTIEVQPVAPVDARPAP